VYNKMGEYSKALSYFERALDIFQSSIPPNHPHIKATREHIRIIKVKLSLSNIVTKTEQDNEPTLRVTEHVRLVKVRSA
jgi:hypothetical protein